MEMEVVDDTADGIRKNLAENISLERGSRRISSYSKKEDEGQLRYFTNQRVH
jgi:hypothetical protein